MSEPAEVSRIGARVEEVAAVWRRTEDVRAELRNGSPIEDDELTEARRLGLAATLDARWRRVIPQRFHRASLSDFGPPVVRDLEEWATNAEGRNLVLTGPVGTGKTHAAIAACRPAHDSGLDVLFMPVVELLDALRPGGTDEVSISDVAEVDRLIIDDLGTQRDTDWTHERLEAVINRRWMEARPTIITTNLDRRALQERFRESTYSRLVGGAVPLRLTGEDRRRQ